MTEPTKPSVPSAGASAPSAWALSAAEALHEAGMDDGNGFPDELEASARIIEKAYRDRETKV